MERWRHLVPGRFCGRSTRASDLCFYLNYDHGLSCLSFWLLGLFFWVFWRISKAWLHCIACLDGEHEGDKTEKTTVHSRVKSHTPNARRSVPPIVHPIRSSYRTGPFFHRPPSTFSLYVVISVSTVLVSRASSASSSSSSKAAAPSASASARSRAAVSWSASVCWVVKRAKRAALAA